MINRTFFSKLKIGIFFTIKLTQHWHENRYICVFQVQMKQCFILLFLPVIWISCGRSSQQEQGWQIAIQDTVRFGINKYSFPQLANNTKEQLENWSVYDDFYSEASTLYDIGLEALRIKTDKLLRHTDSLSKKIPDTLYTNAIYSRLTIVKTRVKLLKQAVDRGIIDKNKVEIYITETNNAVKNLIVQLNEKFQKDRIDLQRIDNEKKELEKQKKFLDSVYNAELIDQQSK